jgi:hypothetical protein
MASIPVEQKAEPPTSETLEQRFRRLATAWDEATCYLSSMEQASKHPAYQEIIRMGPAVVPLLLRDLEATHQHWFIALQQITGAQPIPKSAAGKIPEMAQAWLRWGKDNGYQW